MIIGVKSPEINTLDSPSHGYTPMWLLRMEQWYPCQMRKQMPGGEHVVHSWFTSGALLVHTRCIFGALLVHFRCTSKVSRKGIAPLPKGSLDPPHRNVWIAFLPTCKPERELHRFRKEVSILRTETFGSPFRQLANPKGNCTASERKPQSSAQKRLDRPRHYHFHHRRRRNHDQAAAEYPLRRSQQRGR